MGGGESQERLHPLSAAAAGNYTEKYITSELWSWTSKVEALPAAVSGQTFVLFHDGVMVAVSVPEGEGRERTLSPKSI